MELFALVLISLSVSLMIIYLNYFNIGYTFLDYVKFISKEIIVFLLGIIILYLLNRRV